MPLLDVKEKTSESRKKNRGGVHYSPSRNVMQHVDVELLNTASFQKHGKALTTAKPRDEGERLLYVPYHVYVGTLKLWPPICTWLLQLGRFPKRR